MEKQNGTKILGGIAIGKVSYYSPKANQVVRKEIANVEAEIIRYETAKKKAIEQIQALYEKALKEVGEVNARIFEVHTMLLEDKAYNNSIYGVIHEQGVNAEYAVAVAEDSFTKMFTNTEDDSFEARCADIRDVSRRVIAILNDIKAENIMEEEPVILVTKNLSPSEILQVEKDKLLALVMESCSVNSHTAIIARSMGIPTLTDVEVKESWNGKLAIVDGDKREIRLNPSEAVLEEYKTHQENCEKQNDSLSSLKGQETITLSGQKISLNANIGNVSDLSAVIENYADGIGLFRSEFLYMGKSTFPTEEEQFAIYRQVAEIMNGKNVIIRTLDIGADKQIDYFNLDEEENPAMGCRGIRVCLARKDIFKTQLRAIFRAGNYGNISIMYPMITSLEEVREVKGIVGEVKAELEEEKIPYGNVRQGIMIETPSAVVLSDLLAKEVDFFSIGTNDLTQYTFAIDRRNSKLDSFYNPRSEAILRLIEMTVKNAHAEGIPVGICGELAADMELTEQFLKMGVDELSVSPNYILTLRKKVREVE